MPLILRRRASRRLWGEVECEGFPLATPDGWVAFDTEGTGVDFFGSMGVDRDHWPARAFGFSFCNADGDEAWVRWRIDPWTREVIVDERTRDLVAGLLSNPKIRKVPFNGNFDKRAAEFAGIEVLGELWDTQVGQHVVRPGDKFLGLKELSKKYLDLGDEDETALGESVKRMRSKITFAKKRLQASLAGHVLKGGLKEGDEWLGRFAKMSREEDDDAWKADLWLGDFDLCRLYAKKDARRTAMLHLAQLERLDDDERAGGKLWEIYKDELRLLPIIGAMEKRGIAVEEERVYEIQKFYGDYMADANARVIEEAGIDSFNYNSGPQKQEIFFEDRGYTPLKYVTDKRAKTPNACSKCKGLGCARCQNTGWNPCVNKDFLASIGIERKIGVDGEEVLEEKDPLAYWIVHATDAKKMKDFVDSYDELLVREGDETVIHPSIIQCGPETGRLSCRKPNLQNVAKDDSPKKKSSVPYRPRECFVPRAGKIFYLPDYTQIEIWILAVLSQDPGLKEILGSGDSDTHGRVAQMVWPGEFDLAGAKADKKKPVASLSRVALANLKAYNKTRNRSKNLQFCTVYGGGAKKVAEMIGDGCTKAEAEAFLARYNETFPGVAEFMDLTVREVRKTGRTTNAFGREYQIDREFAYLATNYRIQGTAADLIKRAMIRVDDFLAEPEYAGHAELLLQIHDELIVEGDERYDSEALMRGLVSCMQADWKLLRSPVPFPVGMKVARERWSETMDVDLKAVA